MPGGDRTGPMGNGPLTGGGFGFCGGDSNTRRFSRSGFGGRQSGFGRGRGWRNRFWATGRTTWQRAADLVDPIRPGNVAAERSDLQQETAALESELQRLRARIEELETSGSD